MHLLQTSSTTFDDIVEPVDLGQKPGDILVLSFADSDLAGLAAAYAAGKDALPSLRLAHLRDLRHPMSIDLWIDKCARHAKVIAVRLLGGLDWWRYGVEALSAMARANGIALAVLPGEDRDDPRLTEASTVSADELATLLAYFREGGFANLRGLLRRLATYAETLLPVAEPEPLPRMGLYLPSLGAISLDQLQAERAQGLPVVPILFYRSALLAADTAPIDALCEALGARGLSPAPLFVPSLKDGEAVSFVRGALQRLDPAVIVTTTAFAAGGDGEASALDRTDAPVLQAVVATTRRAAWQESPRGLGPADLAMHVVLPELDGRVLAGALAFKDALPGDDALGFTPFGSRPEPDRVAMVADRIAAWARLRTLPRKEKRIVVLMPDYPGAAGRASYAVGLDVPQSILALLEDLAAAGYAVRMLREKRARCSRPSNAGAMMPRCRWQTTNGASAICPARSPSASKRRGAVRPTIPIAVTAPSVSAPHGSAMCWSCFRLIGAERATAAPPITMRRFRRGTRSSPSHFGSATASRPARWCIWARMARWNGCRARPWR